MRIVSDFDGVLTTQEGEADAVGDRQIQLVGEILGDHDEAKRLFEGYRAIVKADPENYGWVIGGNLTCYADEDPYVFHNAVGSVLYKQGPAEVLEKLKAMGLAECNDFSSKCFAEGTENWRAANGSHLVPEGMEVLNRFKAANVGVVIVSNSSTKRIHQIFDDFEAENGEGTRPTIRGGAMKFVVTDHIEVPVPEADTFGPRQVLLKRGHYYQILEEERPALVIGDVLSLDLSLPVTLRDTIPHFKDMKVCFRRAAHTPDWAVDEAKRRGIYIVDDLRQLPEILGI